jgi:hypothetical protein
MNTSAIKSAIKPKAKRMRRGDLRTGKMLLLEPTGFEVECHP